MADVMRRPTSAQERWAWWEAAISGSPLPCYEDEPQCGFYKARKWARGPFVPARIWMEPQEIGETGELLADEIFRTEIDGRGVDTWKNWLWIAKHPITEKEWKWLSAMSPLLPKRKPH